MKRTLLPTIVILLLLTIIIVLGTFLYNNVIAVRGSDNSQTDTSAIGKGVVQPSIQPTGQHHPTTQATTQPTSEQAKDNRPSSEHDVVSAEKEPDKKVSNDPNESIDYATDDLSIEDDQPLLSDDGYYNLNAGDEVLIDTIRFGNGNESVKMAVAHLFTLEKRISIPGVVTGTGVENFSEPLNDFMLVKDSPYLEVTFDPEETVKLMPKDRTDLAVKVRTSLNAKPGEYRLTVRLVDLNNSTSTFKKYTDLKEIPYLIRILP